MTLEGQTVTVRINDKEIARFRGQAPDAPSYIGLVASSAPAAVDTWSMTDFKVTDVRCRKHRRRQRGSACSRATLPVP